MKFLIKPMMAIALTIVFCYQEIFGEGVSAQFVTVYGMVIAYYFAEEATARQLNGGNGHVQGS